ncbi:MAG: hypothetical protein ABII26_05765 [Pseudomonadota bacterium]
MLEINFSLIIQIANFLFLLFLLNILLYRPIRKILSQRHNEMASLQDMIGGFQSKFSQYKKELESETLGARKEGFKEKEDLKNAGLEEERNQLQGAMSSAEQKMGTAREEIKGKMVDVRQSLQSEVDSFSKELAEKILGRSI